MSSSKMYPKKHWMYQKNVFVEKKNLTKHQTVKSFHTSLSKKKSFHSSTLSLALAYVFSMPFGDTCAISLHLLVSLLHTKKEEKSWSKNSRAQAHRCIFVSEHELLTRGSFGKRLFRCCRVFNLSLINISNLRLNFHK